MLGTGGGLCSVLLVVLVAEEGSGGADGCSIITTSAADAGTTMAVCFGGVVSKSWQELEVDEDDDDDEDDEVEDVVEVVEWADVSEVDLEVVDLD
jgi:hypothetical protein